VAIEGIEMPFVVATGIECSAPTIAGGLRRDELVLTGHRDRVEEDLDLVVGLGITHLRYGIPFHLVAADERRLDWRWTDRAMAAIRERGIEPIVDLLHFGVPDDLWGMGDPALIGRYVAYVRAFVERYPWVRWYTPVNEPFITANLSAGLGWWNERRADDRSFVAALANVVTCAILGTAIIRERRPDAVFLQSDACEAFRPAEPAAKALATFRTERGFLGFDLTYGRRPSPRMTRWLAANGLGEDRLAWFLEHGSSEGAIVGLDYYPANERIVEADGRERTDQRRGFGAIARRFHERYAVPVMLAETNTTTDDAPDWLRDTWNETVALAESGVPVAGYCWYSLTDQVDWDTALREANDTVNSFGLVDLARRRRPVSYLYEDLARTTARLGRPTVAAFEEDPAA
jgi:beta-glucosidase/6-phospho-beta-glucosidase/beta-galactosidase